jgi:hypothetical protein
MKTLNNENNEISNKEKYSFLPNINLNSPFHSRGISENQREFNNKIEVIIKQKYQNRPINQEAMKNKYLKKCKI